MIFANFAICRAEDSTHFKSLAKPAPIPFFFVGVFTEINIISALDIHSSTLFEKKRFTSSTFFYNIF